MNPWTVAMVGVLLNVSGQILLQRAQIHRLDQLASWLQWPVALALLAYAMSFALSAWLYQRIPLSVVTPVMAAAIFTCLLVYDHIALQRPWTWVNMLGTALIVMGIILVTRSDG